MRHRMVKKIRENIETQQQCGFASSRSWMGTLHTPTHRQWHTQVTYIFRHSYTHSYIHTLPLLHMSSHTLTSTSIHIPSNIQSLSHTFTHVHTSHPHIPHAHPHEPSPPPAQPAVNPTASKNPGQMPEDKSFMFLFLWLSELLQTTQTIQPLFPGRWGRVTNTRQYFGLLKQSFEVAQTHICAHLIQELTSNSYQAIVNKI